MDFLRLIKISLFFYFSHLNFFDLQTYYIYIYALKKYFKYLNILKYF